MELLQDPASLPGVGRQWVSSTLRHRLGVSGNGTPSTNRRTAEGCWVVELVLRTATPLGGTGQWKFPLRIATLLGGSGQCNSCSQTQNFHCPPPLVGTVFHSKSCTAHYPQAVWQCVTEFPLPLLRGSGLWNSCITRPHYSGAVGGGARARHRFTARGPCAAGGVRHTASPLGGSGQRNTRYEQPHP